MKVEQIRKPCIRNERCRMSIVRWLSFATLIIGSCFVHAQSTATIFGTVTDPAGAAVRGAKITATT